MKKIIQNKIFKIILSILIIISMFLIPNYINLFLKYITIKNDNISELISLFIYLILIVLIFRKELLQEYKIFKLNTKKCFDIGFKYWFIGLIIMLISNVIINLIIFKGSIAANEELNRSILLENPFYYMLSAVIIGPILEELIFRKNLDGIFKNNNTYYIVSAVLFGFCHTLADLSSPLNLLYIIPYGGLGFAFAAMNKKTKSVFTNIMMHMTHNFITCVLVLTVMKYYG